MGTRREDAFLDGVSKRIVTARTAQGYSQTRLAAESGLTEGHLGHIEQGRRHPSLRTLHRIASGLDTTVSELLKDL